MTLEKLSKMLETSGIPFTYRAWPEQEAPPMPFGCYMVSYNNNFVADGTVYYPIKHVQIELYTQLKDPEAEDKVEKALSSLVWEKTETYIDSEKCYQILYEIEV